MTQEQVYELIGRYMNGETTLAEERRLYEYFREKKDLPQSLHTYREMMLDMDAADGVETGYEAWPAFLPRQESRFVGWWRYVAILVGIALLSGVAYAAFRNHLFSRFWNTEDASLMQVEDELPVSDSADRYVMYDNVSLDRILDEMGSFYHVKVEFIDPATRDIRLFFRWDRQQKVDEVLGMLNHFQQIQIRREKDKLLVYKY